MRWTIVLVAILMLAVGSAPAASDVTVRWVVPGRQIEICSPDAAPVWRSLDGGATGWLVLDKDAGCVVYPQPGDLVDTFYAPRGGDWWCVGQGRCARLWYVQILPVIGRAP